LMCGSIMVDPDIANSGVLRVFCIENHITLVQMRCKNGDIDHNLNEITRNWQSGYNWWKEECCKKLGVYAGENQLCIAVATQAGRTMDEDFPAEANYSCQTAIVFMKPLIGITIEARCAPSKKQYQLYSISPLVKRSMAHV